MLSNGGDILNIPKVKEETAAQKQAGESNPVAYSAQTDGVVQLNVDQHFYEAKRIEVRFKVPCTAVVNIAEARIERVFIWDCERGLPGPKPEGIADEDYEKAVDIWLDADDSPGWEFG